MRTGMNARKHKIRVESANAAVQSPMVMTGGILKKGILRRQQIWYVENQLAYQWRQKNLEKELMLPDLVLLERKA